MQCPRCQLELPLAIAGTGHCPACAYVLNQADIANWLDELEQADTAQTDFSLVQPDDLNRTVSDLQRTLQSDDESDRARNHTDR
jgi:hypothetical protein